MQGCRPNPILGLTQLGAWAIGLLMPVHCFGQVVFTEPPRTWSVGYDIPDLQDPPVTFQIVIADSAILQITDIQVGLRLQGTTPGAGFASEMFVSLNKDLGASAILLNQVGLSAVDAVGFGYDGWNVRFQDSAVNSDVHVGLLESGVLSGDWQPDGRLRPEDTSRPSMLASLFGGPGNGLWYLNVADLAPGGKMRLIEWSITLVGYTPQSFVPEGSTWVSGVAVLLLGGVWVLHRRIRSGI